MNEELNLLTEQPDPAGNVISESGQGASEEIEVYVLNDTYAGTISDTYLDYFAGIVEKLFFNEHYVIWRSGLNEYTMAYGSDLCLNGYVFTGSDCWVITIWRESDNYSSNWYVSHSIDSVDLDASTSFVYTDLGVIFPTVKRGWSSIEGTAFLFAFAFMFVFIVIRDIFKYVSR